MGLLNLKDKIGITINNNSFTQSEVLYLLVEMRKYAERSADSNLNRPTDQTIKEKDFRVIQFFRNWSAHPKKNIGPIPESILNILNEITNESEDLNKELENKLFTTLEIEVGSFCSKTKINCDTKNMFNNTNFVECLKKVLHEQPVHVGDSKRVGYNDNLLLIATSD